MNEDNIVLVRDRNSKMVPKWIGYDIQKCCWESAFYYISFYADISFKYAFVI